MKILVWNMLLAVAWALALGEVTLLNLAVGFALGYLVLGLLRGSVGQTTYFRKAWQIVSFSIFFLWQLLMANLRVAYDVLTPTYYMRPGIIAVPLDCETPEEITLLANLITLTPGSLSLDLSHDRKTLYVHSMFIDDIEQERRNIKDGLERRVLEVMR
jgi:multicomponent Na+:H+ antiporter subunit E